MHYDNDGHSLKLEVNL